MNGLTLAEAAQLVRRDGHDPPTWNGARRAMRLMCRPRPEEQLELFDDLLEHARKSVMTLPAEVAT